MKKTKTISKHFWDSQILGVSIDDEGRRVIHLKMGVRKQYNSGYIDYDSCYQRNEIVDNLDMHKKIKLMLYGEGDFSNEESYD